MGKARKGESMEGEIKYTNEELISRYIYHRNKKNRARKFWQAIEAGRNECLEVISQTLLQRMKEQGEQNVRTSTGTAFRVTKWSVTTADKVEFVREIVTCIVNRALEDDWESPEQMIDAILDSDALALLDARPDKEAALAYLDLHKTPPPGINIDGSYKVQVRKS